MNDQDPLPLADAGSGAPPFLRDALRAARAELPSAPQVARLAARLPLALPVAAAAPPSVLSGALIGAALGVIVAGAGLFWDTGREPSAPPPPPAAVVAASRPAPAPPAAEVLDVPAPPPIARPLPLPPAPPAPAASASAGEIAPAPRVTPPEAVPAPATGGPAGAGPIGRDDSVGEVELIGRARERLGRSPAEALALTGEHARRFPRGVLGQEREVLAIEALRGLGRTDEARARKDAFLSAYPGSAHRPRLQTLFGP